MSHPDRYFKRRWAAIGFGLPAILFCGLLPVRTLRPGRFWEWVFEFNPDCGRES